MLTCYMVDLRPTLSSQLLLCLRLSGKLLNINVTQMSHTSHACIQYSKSTQMLHTEHGRYSENQLHAASRCLSMHELQPGSGNATLAMRLPMVPWVTMPYLAGSSQHLACPAS
jgi:hypothetical protein